MQPLAVTMGEPAGIGGEIALLGWAQARGRLPAFAMIDNAKRLDALSARLNLGVPIVSVDTLSAANAAFSTALPVLDLPLPVAAEPGKLDARNAKAVIAAIDRALTLALRAEAAGIVTNPVHKATLYDAGFTAPGHTEYIAQRIGGSLRPVMMLCVPGLRVVPVSVHLSLAEAIRTLTSEAIEEAGLTTAASLRADFGIGAPRLVVAALNPHAGESGALGREEIEIVAPAIAALRKAGLDVRGPLPADTLFHAAARKTYDAALCLYHDQALIPLKTIDFAQGVNVTLGLPIVRTSPDHGTALDIAGQGKADPSSFIAALGLAGTIASRRAAMR